MSLIKPIFALLSAFWLTLALPVSTHAQGADIGGEFRLTNIEGQPFGSENLKGKPYALFFGFTHCPEVCPTTLSEIAFSLQELGSDADRLTTVFVTVDPERDTAETLKEYLGFFDKRIVGLRGTPEEIASVARAFRATYKKVALTDGDYTVDHTAVIYLIDGEGTFFDKIDYRETSDVQLEKYRRLIEADRVGGEN
ncbi:SCO family protein [Brucella gallinifaecis]|uniref:SCO family protein n=1 Tax=Brucella gallinifaecis TaxID=215590 RepID=A0A502BRX6_9HYPH|nr:SCO family protein [Brucella gallinifaecis]TPF76974.1 SCO family protein [Brucella gallinifaecis]